MPVFVEKTTSDHSRRQTRVTERYSLAFVSVFLLILFWSLYSAKSDHFREVDFRLAQGSIVNVNAVQETNALSQPLARAFRDSLDRDYVATQILATRANGSFPNIGALNLITVPALDALEKGGAYFASRVTDSRKLIGFSGDLYEREQNNPDSFPSVSPHGNGPVVISGLVLGPDHKPRSRTLVTLSGEGVQDTVRTADNGTFQFLGLESGDYAVLAMAPAVEFRRSRIFSASGRVDMELQAQEHTIRLLDAGSFSRIKPNLIARSPQWFRTWFPGVCMLFVFAFWLVHLVWTWKGFEGDGTLLPVLLGLSGLGIFVLFSIPDPLRDYARGVDTGAAMITGAVFLGIISFVDIQKFGYEWSERKGRSGWWIGAAAVLSLFLLTAGFGPQGSDARVNLPIFLIAGPGIQPVEIIKACLLIFFAGYLARNWQFLREIDAAVPKWLGRLRLQIPGLEYLIPIVSGVFLALFFFFLQKDLGPALVLCATFLVLYGIVRRHWIAVSLGFGVLILGFWLAYGLHDTVSARIEMWLHPWQNTARGGDHLAHAYWAFSSGGFWGAGAGSGSPIDMPSAHTDLVLAAIGEELGLWGFVLGLGLYAWLLVRSLDVALRSDARFSFFLAAGISISSTIQIILITGGITGLLPLSGVVSPFLSYGKTALFMHFLFWGAILSISARPATDDSSISRDFSTPVRVTKWVLLGVLCLLGLRGTYIQTIQADAWAVKPTLVFQASGLRGYSYNPRLLRIRDALAGGSIFDRNGLPLATDDPDLVSQNLVRYGDLGINPDTTREFEGQRLYPTGSLMFYAVGDLNTRVKWNAPNALYAENRYLSELRGYDNHPLPSQDTVFLPEGGDTTYTVVSYDYGPLLPYLRHGLNTKNPFVSENRDVTLTLDTRLQSQVYEAIRYQSTRLNISDRIISALVMDSKSGEILASVNYPAPDIVFTNPSAAAEDPDIFDRAIYATRPPGSTLKIATSMAAFRTAGDEALEWVVDVSGDEMFYRPGAPTGRITMEQAIIGSSNVYFATVTKDRIPAENLLDILNPLGFTIKSQYFSRAQQLQSLYDNEGNNLAQAGFGQGQIVAAPLHVARMASVVANGGTLPAVQWKLLQGSSHVLRDTLITTRQAGWIKGFMRGVVESGTARAIKNTTTLPVYGKTGTAQQTGMPNHGWFVGFTPDGSGSFLVVAVLVEEAGSLGASAAYPIAGTIFNRARTLGLIKQ